jgi:hypothetical protein
VRRARAALLGTVVLLAAGCTGDDLESGAADAVATTTTTEPVAEDVGLSRALIEVEDLEDPAYETTVPARRFAAAAASRLSVCDEDLRVEFGVVAGRQVRFSDGEVEVSHTITRGGEPGRFVERFEELVESCAEPWIDPELPSGGGPVERELIGAYPVDLTGIDAVGAIIRSRNDRGISDTIVVVLHAATLVSSLSVSGPVGSEFDVVDAAVEAAAQRLRASVQGGQSPGSP